MWRSRRLGWFARREPNWRSRLGCPGVLTPPGCQGGCLPEEELDFCCGLCSGEEVGTSSFPDGFCLQQDSQAEVEVCPRGPKGCTKEVASPGGEGSGWNIYNQMVLSGAVDSGLVLGHVGRLSDVSARQLPGDQHHGGHGFHARPAVRGVFLRGQGQPCRIILDVGHCLRQPEVREVWQCSPAVGTPEPPGLEAPYAGVHSVARARGGLGPVGPGDDTSRTMPASSSPLAFL